MKICRRLTQPAKSQNGLTLIELIIVMVLVGILAGFISTLISYEAETYDKLVDQTNGLQVSRTALQFMQRDFRHIMDVDSIFHASQDSIKFDLLDDVYVSYTFLENRIRRNSDILLEAVQDFQLSFFDTLGVELASPVTALSDIRAIGISLTTSMNGQPFTLNTTVQPRNFYKE